MMSRAMLATSIVGDDLVCDVHAQVVRPIMA
jgi:hypothetical protein